MGVEETFFVRFGTPLLGTKDSALQGRAIEYSSHQYAFLLL
jgi:hypothetical protein